MIKQSDRLIMEILHRKMDRMVEDERRERERERERERDEGDRLPNLDTET